jgi:putative colanic acid biosynthesis acetyltransferase WcaF
MLQKLRPNHLSLNNKIARGLWKVVCTLLYRPSPRPLHAWRALLLRMFGAKIGSGVRVYPSVRIWAPWNLEMRDRSCLGDWVDCYSVDKVILGVGATVSQYSFLCTASRDYTDTAMPLITAPITLGDKAWVTVDVFVGPGVTIGEGAVVTARSSVFSDIPAWTVAGGNPAVAKKPRSFSSKTPES